MQNPVLISESFERAASNLSQSLERFEQSVEQFRTSVDKLATVLGMQAENDQRKVLGHSMAYTASDFESV